MAIAIAVLLARSMPVAASMAVALAFLTIALSGHANSAEPRSWAVLTDWIHLIAAAIWIGGIAQIALAWLPAIRRLDREARLAVIGSVLSRFGRVALPAFLVVAASGLGNALIQLGEVSALWQTSYGRVLAVKIVFVGLIALASYGHALRLRPRLAAANPHPPERLERRHWRLLGAEPWLGLGAIIAVAALVAFPLPPSQLGETEGAEAAAPCDPCPQPKAKSDQLPVAEHAGPWIAAFWLERQGEQLTGTLRLLDNDTKPIDASAELPGGELSDCGVGCWRLAVPAGGEEISVTVEGDGDQYTATVPARWIPQRSERAKRLLKRAQETMRSLDSTRMSEEITSGPGTFVRTGYRFGGEDRFAYRTSSGGRAVVIGGKQYSFQKGRWRKSSFAGGTGPFSLTAFFRWSAYARATRWLGGDARTVELALFDPATPLWYRLTIERDTGRIVRERMIATAHFMSRRYFAFNEPLSIIPPR